MNENYAHRDLKHMDFRHTDLTDASLYGADLRGARIDETTNLHGADLRGTIGVPFIPMVCPSHGPFIGWKVAKDEDGVKRIVKLLIPADARRVSGTTRHCRCDKAFVISIENDLEVAYSINDPWFKYRVGQYVYPDSFTEDRFDNYGHGIYFFVDRAEAENYRR